MSNTRWPSHTWNHLLTWIVAWTWLASLGWAQDSPSPSATDATSIQERILQLDSVSDLDDAEKVTLRDVLQQTLLEMEKEKKWTARAREYRGAIESATTDAERAQRELERLRSAKVPPVPAHLSISELKERVARREGDMPALRTEATAAENESNRRLTRRPKISQLLTDLPKRLAAVQADLKNLPPDDEPSEVTEARRNYLVTQRNAIRRQIEALESERAKYDATIDLLPIQRRLAALNLERAEDELRNLQIAIGQRQREDVEKQLADAERALSEVNDELRPAVEEAVQLARRRRDTRRRFEAVSKRLEELRLQLNELRTQAARARDQIHDTGLTYAMGQLLRYHRTDLLPDDKALRSELAKRQAEIQSLQQSMFESEKRQRELEAITPNERPKWYSAITEREPSYETLRLRYLDLLIADMQAYFYELVDLDSTTRELLTESRKYARYIDEHALWIRDAGPVQFTDVGQTRDALSWLIAPARWGVVGRTIVDDARAQPVLMGFAAAILVLLLYGAELAHRKVVELGDRAMRSTTQQFAPTLATFILTVLSALPWPALMVYVGWRLATASASLDFVYALGTALWQTAVPFFLLLLARETCRAKGLAGAHFGWTATDLAPLRRWLRLLMVGCVPLIFVATLFEAAEDPPWGVPLGRASLALLGLMVAIFFHRLLLPYRGLLYRVSIAAREGPLYRGRYLLYAVSILLPLVVAGAAVSGYYLAAKRLAVRSLYSALLLFGLLMLGSLLFRWVLVTRRRLAMQQARARREAQQRAAESRPVLDNGSPDAAGAAAVASVLDPRGSSESNPNQASPPVAAESEVDLTQITTQTRRFLWTAVSAAAVAGLWAIWIDVLPALGILNNIELWQSPVVTTETIETTTGSVITREISRIEVVTLADAILVVVLILLTVVAARNLPGLLEMGLWQRLPLDAGTRFAISAATRYLIYIVAVLVVARQLSFEWSKVGWLVAALLVGLGFGLQEIFANFISGLIVLVEQPVRIGDLVTIGDINGTVNKIQMRATTIRDWNHRELVVPNKKLVTENLINWTLTDSNYRVDLLVGIAYGSDTEKAREILLKIAADHPKILPKPRPKAIFRAFGDSALEIEFRIYIPHMDFWPRVLTEVNTAIAREFKQAGVEIAFPQRDIHIRSIEAALPLADTGSLSTDERLKQPFEAS